MKGLLETIKVCNGRFDHLKLHLERMERSSKELYGKTVSVDLSRYPVPEDLLSGIVKCRILYSPESVEVGYAAYHPKEILSLKLVVSDEIDYHLKYADRRALTVLTEQKEGCSDILIVKHGRITDTSYSNVLFQRGNDFILPEDCLLDGCKRRQLIAEGRVRVEPLTPSDLGRFESVHLINAMLDPGQVCIPVSEIYL